MSAAARPFLWGAIAVALFLLALALGFIHGSHESVLVCLFAQPTCSTAVAAWSTALIAAFAFVAAYDAAVKAGDALKVSQDTYDLEIRPRFGVSLCVSDHKRASIQVFVVSPKDANVGKPPAGYALDRFQPVAIDFENLGRSVLMNMSVEVRLSSGDQSRDLWIYVGNIAATSNIHADFHVLKGAYQPPDLAFTGRYKVDEQVLTYRPPEKFTTEATVDISATAAAAGRADAVGMDIRVGIASSSDVTNVGKGETK